MPVANAELPLPTHRHGEVFEDFLFTRSDGAWLERGAFLAQRMAQASEPGAARQAPPGADVGVAPIEDLRVRRAGRVALVHGVRTGPTARLRFTDVYLWCDTDWRLVSAQDTALAPGVQVALAAGVEPPHSQWPGPDPAPDDPAALHMLNESYVRAFRDADVAWYASHLAPEYLMIASDGSLIDRAATLARFARPTFASTMKDFPVGRVRVRRFGDTALIHAENAYELKDGRRGTSRYTDIWHRAAAAGGRWLCVAAHITTHRNPV